MYRIDKFQDGDVLEWNNEMIKERKYLQLELDYGNGPFIAGKDVQIINVPYEYDDFDDFEMRQSNWSGMGHTQAIKFKENSIISAVWFKEIVR